MRTFSSASTFDTATFELALRPITASLDSGAATGQGSDTFEAIEAIVGSPEADDLTGNHLNNAFAGLDGDDTIRGRGGIDRIFGGRGGDRLFGGATNDHLDGEEGIDFLHGGFGMDVCLNGESHISCEEIDAAESESAQVGSTDLSGSPSYLDYVTTVRPEMLTVEPLL